MNRRGFLKSIGKVVAGVVALPSLDKAKEPTQPEWVKESFRRQDICRPKPEDGNCTFEALKKRVQARQDELDYIQQNIFIMSDEEHEEYIRKALKEQNFPKAYVEDSETTEVLNVLNPFT